MRCFIFNDCSNGCIMKTKIQLRMKKIAKLSVFFWITGYVSISPLHAQIRGSSVKNNFTLSDLEANYSTPINSNVEFLILIVFLLVIVIVSFISFQKRKKKRKITTKIRMTSTLTSQPFQTILENLTRAQMNLLQRICATDDEAKLITIIKSGEEFEKNVQHYKKSRKPQTQKNQHELELDAIELELDAIEGNTAYKELGEPLTKEELDAIFTLRQDLNLNILNKNCPFVSTQMLVKNQKLQCQVERKGKYVVFTANINNISEEGILIKAPLVKGKPANLKQFGNVKCRLRRNQDADYEFELPVVLQKSDNAHKVVLLHTNKIRKMAIRDSERVNMQGMRLQFRTVKEALYNMKEKFEPLPEHAYNIDANVLDLSAGGMKLILNQMPEENFQEGDIFLFHLKYASLREDIAGTVRGIIHREKTVDVHLQFRDSSTLARMKLLQYLHRFKKEHYAA